MCGSEVLEEELGHSFKLGEWVCSGVAIEKRVGYGETVVKISFLSAR